MRVALCLSAAIALSGCLPVPPPKAPNRLVGPSNAIRAECASQPTRLAQERCANPRILALYRADGSMPMDIGEAYMARREAIAEKMDRGEISEAEGDAEMAEARVRANAEGQRRQPAPAVICTTAGGVTVCQ